MALSRDRVLKDGVTPHPWEREAIEFIKSTLPDGNPYLLWALVDVVEPSGRRHEVDALVLGHNALYLIEIKSHPGRFAGNGVDWTHTWPDGQQHVMENPLPGASRKARVLAGLLDRDHKGRRPRVEALVFLANENVDISGLDSAGRNGVVTRKTFFRAITLGEFEGAYAALSERTVSAAQMRETAQAFLQLNIAASKGERKLGDLLIGDVIDEGPGYQDHVALHQTLKQERRVRAYLVAESSTEERRDQLKRAAMREARILSSLSHPHVLRCFDIQVDSPTGGPCLVFEHNKAFERLDVFLRKRPKLAFEDRVAIVQQVGEAVGYCHQHKVLHRGIDPQAVLVRGGGDDGPIDTRLLNFQLAMHVDTKGTVHLSALSELAVYRAPELVEDPDKAAFTSDLFSLGALAWFVFVGRAPARNLAERHAMLTRDGRLSLASASDALAGVKLHYGPNLPHAVRRFDRLDDLIGGATTLSSNERFDSATEFVDHLLHVREDDESDARAPSEAVSGDVLRADDGTELLVEAVLGTGSTARVFKVSEGEEVSALKVALDPEHDERLEAEAAVLVRARGDRIVRLKRKLTFGRHTGLLLQYAGSTLAELLTTGPVGLDDAPGWGEDLLLALESLEELGVTHKDIKPANLGVTDASRRRTQHMMLFDFSLAAIGEREVLVGTPAYRDRFLHERGAWDAAADRFSAAMALYEMLTGKLPTWGGEDIAVTTDAEVTLVAERFDPGVREALAAFFQKALARDVARRFVSAAEMRRTWNLAFIKREVRPAEGSATASAPPEGLPAKISTALPTWPDEVFANVREATPVEALPLSNRAKNALDRAGLLTFGQLLKTSRTALQKLKGIGRETSREVLAFRDAWHLAHPAVEAPTPAPSPDTEATPETDAAPTTLAGWIAAFVPPASRAVRGMTWIADVRALLGLDGEAPLDAPAYALRRKLSRQAVYIKVGQARAHWSTRPELRALHALLHDTLDARGGLSSATSLTETFARACGASQTEALSELDLVHGRALVEIARATDESVASGVLHGQRWIASDRSLLDVARALGAEADRLCDREVLASADESRARLAPLVASTTLARLGVEELLSIAAEASTRAACSARLELYPRGMSATRALSLCASVFTDATFDEAKLRSAVTSRYSQAEQLPARPALDALVQAEFHAAFNAESQRYERARVQDSPSSLTLAPLPSRPTARPALKETARALVFQDESARDFDERLRVTAARRTFRVVSVSAIDAPDAARALGRRLNTRVFSFDKELWASLLSLAEREGIAREVITDADRAGPAGEDWETLRAFVRDAAAEVLARWSSQREPLVIRDLGLAARYGLREFVDGLVELARKDDGPAVFLVLAPRPGEDGDSPIDGGALPPLPVPNPMGAPRLVPPRAWLAEMAG